MTDPVLLERRGNVAVVTMNRPERANVLDGECSAALSRIAAALAADDTLRAVLLTGNGAHFCAGGDIQGFVTAGSGFAETLAETLPRFHETLYRLASLPVPVVSALNGSVGGGGIGLALCADIVLAAESMKLRGGYSAIGLTPDLGGSWQLARLVGPMRAKQILFMNRVWTARQCLDAGLVAEVHADADLMPAALKMVDELARGATGSLARIKALVNGAPARSLEEQLALECRSMIESAGSEDAAEGVRAFVEKRVPRFGAAKKG